MVQYRQTEGPSHAVRLGIVCGALACLFVVIALFGMCSRPGDESGSQAASEQVASSGHGELGQVAAEQAEPADDGHFVVTLGFAGDICFADNYIPQQHLSEIGSSDISDGIDQRFIDLMRNMSIMWINNEFAYSDRGEPLEGKAYTFCSKPEHVTYLHDLGVDIVGLANNHTFDFGEEAFLDTLSTLEGAGIPEVGAGHDLSEAKAPVYLEAEGLTIAYVAASCAELTIYTPEATDTEPGILWCYDDDLFLESIREAAENADYVIALPHWGTEHSTVLEDKQLTSARAYIDAGADAVIGAHPHILQGIEFYDGKPIMYSLGNFWFDDYDIDTLVAEIRIEGERDSNGAAQLDGADIQLVLYPGTQSGVFTAYADTDGWRRQIFDDLEYISVNATINDDGTVHVEQ